MLSARAAQMTPMVAAVPKEVPVRKETAAQRRKEASTIHCGPQKGTARLTMAGMVPQARHRAVMTPMRRKMKSTLRTVFTPFHAMRSISRAVCRRRPQAKKRMNPRSSAQRIDSPDARQAARDAAKRASTAVSMTASFV